MRNFKVKVKFFGNFSMFLGRECYHNYWCSFNLLCRNTTYVVVVVVVVVVAELLENYLKCNLTTTTVSSRVEGDAKIGGPEWFVNCGKIQLHLVEYFYKMMAGFDL